MLEILVEVLPMPVFMLFLTCRHAKWWEITETEELDISRKILTHGMEMEKLALWAQRTPNLTFSPKKIDQTELENSKSDGNQ